uniref:Cell division cycle protein 123 homolog n=1 Tax=Ditylum brightwellii TaxID=49249 RepID=A0A6U3T2K3_9STRA|mmetsp:Transcript_36329/g.54228  ORF Transcript_36329/g.54228 Transcript_36329/m.54228 type:complete len:364 (+) Transcript_36329:118-1209(+)
MFLSSIKAGGVHLKPAETVDKTLSAAELQRTEPDSDNSEELTAYFFQAGVDKWYNQLKECTFKSDFVLLLPDEVNSIIRNWKALKDATKENSSIPPTKHIPDQLNSLVERIDNSIQTHFHASSTLSAQGKVFIKLSSRSPKDSKTILKRASERYEKIDTSKYTLNDRLSLFSELMLKCSCVSSGKEAVTIMLDSCRIAEDLMAAYSEDDHVLKYNVSIVVRGWDSRISPKCEFRGFVIDRKLTCIGQYWHHLRFPELDDIKEQVGKDCLEFFETLKEHLPVPNAMLDFAWLGPGKVILIEVNPLADGLGSFRGSTGLFGYEEDVLQGKASFEVRLCTKEAQKHELQYVMDPEWRKILLVDQEK